MKYPFWKRVPYGKAVSGYWEINGQFLATHVSGTLEKFQRLAFIPESERLKMPLALQSEIRAAIKKV